MKIRIASILFMFLTLLPIYGKSENHGAVKANFDERIELMIILTPNSSKGNGNS